MRQKLLMLLLVCSVNATAQDIAIRDIDYSSDFYLSETQDKNFRIIYKIKNKNRRQSLFRKIDFDSLMTLSDTTVITLNGKFRFIGSDEGSKYIVSAMLNTDTGVLHLHWLDKETGEQFTTPVATSNYFLTRRLTHIKIHSSRDPESFFVLHFVKKRQWDVLMVSKDGKIKFKRSIDSGGKRLGLVQSFIQDNLILVLNKNSRSRATAYEVLILDGSTGQEKSNQVLSSKKARIAIDNAFSADSTVYLAVRKFFSNRIKNNQPGMPSLVAIDPETGSVQDSRLNAASIPYKVFWIDVVNLPDGGKCLVGETFTSESFGAYFTKAMVTSIATLGMLSVTWSSLKWRDVVVLPINVDNAKPIHQTLAPRRVQIGTYLPAYHFASLARHSGQIRYYGHSNEGHLYLLDDKTFKKYAPDLTQHTNLGQLPTPRNSLVISTRDDYAIVATRGISTLNISVLHHIDNHQ